jgi:hypothetical protein
MLRRRATSLARGATGFSRARNQPKTIQAIQRDVILFINIDSQGWYLLRQATLIIDFPVPDR